VRLIRQVGEPGEIADALFALADLLDRRGELARGEALFEESLVLYRKAGDDLGVAANLIVSATGLWWRSPADATPLQIIRHRLQEAQAIVTKLGSRYWIGYCSWLGALVALSEGETARAESLAQASLTIFREIGAQWFVALALYVLGRVEVQRGEMIAARSWYLQSLEISLELGDKFFTPFYLEGLADVLAAQGELTRAAQLWGAAEALRQEIAVPLHPVDRARYEQAVATARAQLGEKAFAAAWAQGRTMPLEQVLAAQEPVSMAASIPADRGMAPPVPTASTSGLTAREVEVLRFVAQGLTDEQVAEQLVISRHTVNSHLKAIYGKIGVTSRSAATRYAIEHQLL
jgi:ATP/maltotriose-dependent transcriptional regulator MalT